MTRRRPAALVGGLCLLAGACSAHPPTRFDVWGEVTFDGKPVPAGLIVFNPDLAKGNDGPQGVAEIRGGRYDTRTLDKGAPPGAVVLVIDGFDGVARPDAPYGRPLFTGYKLRVELPREPAEKNISVPAAAASTKGTAPLP